MNHELLLKSLEDTKKLLDENNIPFFLFWGTLLGAIREKKIIEGDDDVDIAIFPKYAKQVEGLKEKFKELGYELGVAGCISSQKKTSYNPCVFSLKDNEFRYMTIAVLFLFENNRWYMCQQAEVNHVASWLGFPYPKEYFEKEEYMSFYGKEYRVPNPTEKFIEYMYGDWKTPSKIHFGIVPTKTFYPGEFIDEENKG